MALGRRQPAEAKDMRGPRGGRRLVETRPRVEMRMPLDRRVRPHLQTPSPPIEGARGVGPPRPSMPKAGRVQAAPPRGAARRAKRGGGSGRVRGRGARGRHGGAGGAVAWGLRGGARNAAHRHVATLGMGSAGRLAARLWGGVRERLVIHACYPFQHTDFFSR
ncbi:MAG: hypothetical protein J3K34DRAFT_30171 [Monoraphidium minutum]|nr:MAG: hypothetical protein J3K34DRAFT_30171 [Monoraphidium minutum]